MSIFHDKALKGVAEAAAKIMAETSHELKGNQHKIDANKNGKIDAHDFKLLRAKKDMKKEEVGLDEAKTQSKDEKDKVVGAVTKAMRQSYANVMQGRNERSAARMNAKIKNNMKEEIEQLDEVGDTPAGRKALGSYVTKAIADKTKDRTKGLRKATSRMYKDNYYGKKTNEEVEQLDEISPATAEKVYKKRAETELASQRRNSTNPPGAKADAVQDKAEKKADRSREVIQKRFGTTTISKIGKDGKRLPDQTLAHKIMSNVHKNLKEEVELDEAFPTVADAKKRMEAGKTATGSVTKTATGLVHKRDYKDDDEDDAPKKSTGYGARQNYKRSTRVNESASFTEMLELYNEHGLKVLAPIETEDMDIDGTTIEVIDGNKVNGFVATIVEEPDNEQFTKELKDQQASAAGKKPQPKVAAGRTMGVKTMPESVEQIDERELTTGEAKKKEEYVKGMKKKLSGFKQRYGERAKSVMYATATRMAKKD